ncbi:MAG: cation-transporting P-type ATPase [Candidatus Diapherotrites archaeon]
MTLPVQEGNAPLYYARSPEETIQRLQTRKEGLTHEEAAQRLSEYGKNTITLKKKINVIGLLIGQFTELLVLVLIAAGILSWLVGDTIDTMAIFAIVILNGLLGFLQEFKAEKAIDELKKMGALRATVRRNEKWEEIDAITVVPGDIVQLEEGTKIPADIRFIEAIETAVDEAILTGESNPVSKRTDRIQGIAGIADRKNCGYANTSVVRGRGIGVVIATGLKTEFGKIAQKMQEVEEEPSPLKQHLGVLAQQMTKGVLVIMVLLFILGYFVQGRNIVEMLLLAISLGVAAIPEGLPAITTITLALGIQKMAKENALIKHLPSAETLGSTTVICSDKTGTLTKNEMTCEYLYADEKLYRITGVGYSPRGEIQWNDTRVQLEKNSGGMLTLEGGVYCNNAQYDIAGEKILGDPTEGAMLVSAHKGEIANVYSRVKEVPFTSERKRMSVVCQDNESYHTYMKGAVEMVLEHCQSIWEHGQAVPLTPLKKQYILEQTETLSKSAYRVLGFAYRKTKIVPSEPEQELTFTGLQALRDPPREEVREAIHQCQEAGIKVKIITGDHPITAKAIAEKLGLKGNAITGQELNEMDEMHFREAVHTHALFARVDPEHKYKIVEQLQKMGEVVAVTGDGVNDAPAIKRADIGIAMGIKGTDVAKEASAMVLRDDNFATIVKAVELGRTIYQNLQGFVRYLLAANLAEILVVSLGFFLQIGEILAPIQLLWINLATDALPALALGEDPPAKDVMQRKPRPKEEGILDRMKSFIVISAIMGTTLTLGMYLYGLQRDTAYAGTLAFTTLVVFELLLVFNSRQEGKSILECSPFTNKWLILAVLASFGLQLIAVYVPFLDPVFKTKEIVLNDWIYILGGSLLTASITPYIDRVWKWMRKKYVEKTSIMNAWPSGQ